MTRVITSHDSKVVVTASMDGTIIIWDAQSGTIVQEWLAHRHAVCDLALSPDGRRLVSAGGLASQPLLVWDIDYDVRRAVAPEGPTESPATCAWSLDGKSIASASQDGTVRVWDSQTFQQRNLLEDPQAVSNPRQLQFSPDGRCLAWLSYSDITGCYVFGIWKHLPDECGKPFFSHSSEEVCISALSFDREGRRVATAHGSSGGPIEDHVVRIWDVHTGDMVGVLAGHTKPVTGVSFFPNGRSVMSASSDGSTKIWDTESGQEVATLVADGEEIITACLSADGKYVATLLVGGNVRLWRTDDYSCTTFIEHQDNVMRIAFSPNGEFLVSGGDSGLVHIRRLSDFI